MLFNILGPALNQVDNMQGKKKGIAGAVGLASLMAAGQADAAQEVMDVAIDGRFGILLLLLGPVAVHVAGAETAGLAEPRERVVADGATETVRTVRAVSAKHFFIFCIMFLGHPLVEHDIRM